MVNDSEILNMINGQHFYLHCISHSIHDIASANLDDWSANMTKWFSHESFTVLNTLSHVVEKRDYQYSYKDKAKGPLVMNKDWYVKQGKDHLSEVWQNILNHDLFVAWDALTTWQLNQLKTVLYRPNNTKQLHETLNNLINNGTQEEFWNWCIKNQLNYMR